MNNENWHTGYVWKTKEGQRPAHNVCIVVVSFAKRQMSGKSKKLDYYSFCYTCLKILC